MRDGLIVGVTLSLKESWIRRDAMLHNDLVPVPRRRSVAIATSSARGDSGVFEFSFRDERYMPFEGAGAVSLWQVSLPSEYRPFDYATISDVVLHLAYEAEHDGVLRNAVEGSGPGSIKDRLQASAPQVMISLRQECPDLLRVLISNPVGTEVRFTLSDALLPHFMKGRECQISSASLVLRTGSKQQLGSFTMLVNDQVVNEFARDASLGNLWAAGLSNPLFGEHRLVVQDAGDLAAGVPDAGTLDPDKISDILIYIRTSLAPQ